MKNIFRIEELNKMDMDKERQRVLDYFFRYYNSTDTYEFKLRFIFFCWHMLIEGNEFGYESFERTRLYDEDAMDGNCIIEEKMDGISFNLLGILITHLSTDVFKRFAWREDYIHDAMFANIIKTVDWPFLTHEMDDVESEAKKLVKRAYEAMPDNPIIKREHLYNVTQTPDEQDYIRKMFPSDNLFDVFFRDWYIRDECNR